MRISVVLDCADPEALAPFWEAALEQERVWDGGPFVVFRSESDDRQPVFILQKIDEPGPVSRQPLHIDLHPWDADAKRAELEGLGATFVARHEMPEIGVWWFVMRDPAGNVFCLVQDPPPKEPS